jgi:NAD(P)-dependent dehydrogenase (short-subunit alcohol dehydrogenase family)
MSRSTAIVTGAGSGLGRAVATELAAADFDVVCGRREAEAAADEDAATPTQAGAEADEDALTVVRTDVRDEYDVERLCETAARVGDGGVDAVVPAAAVDHAGPEGVALGGDSYAAFDDQERTNTRGVYAVIRESVPHLAENARVVVPLHQPDESGNGGTFEVSRAGARALTEGFAAELPAAVGVLDPGHPVPAFQRADGPDPTAPAAGVRRALTAVDADRLDGADLGPDEWEA